LLAAPKIMSGINNFAIGKLNAYTGDKAYGVQSDQLPRPLGEFLLKNNYRLGFRSRLRPQRVRRRSLRSRSAFVEMRYLDGGEGLIGDTKLYLDVEQDGTTKVTDEYRSQLGWGFRHEVKHALLYNVTARKGELDGKIKEYNELLAELKGKGGKKKPKRNSALT
jgi:hypothetical protein